MVVVGSQKKKKKVRSYRHDRCSSFAVASVFRIGVCVCDVVQVRCCAVSILLVAWTAAMMMMMLVIVEWSTRGCRTNSQTTKADGVINSFPSLLIFCGGRSNFVGCSLRISDLDRRVENR